MGDDEKRLVDIRLRLRRGYPGARASAFNDAKNDIAFLLALAVKKDREADSLLSCLGRLAVKLDASSSPADPTGTPTGGLRDV